MGNYKQKSINRYILKILILSLFLYGCGTLGKNFDETLVKKIVKNSTTKQEVEGMFGTTSRKEINNDYSIWTYQYDEYSYFTDGIAKDLDILFDKAGVVQAYRYQKGPSTSPPSRVGVGGTAPFPQITIPKTTQGRSIYYYDVSGYFEDGTYVYGRIEAQSQNQNVDGYIYREDGKEEQIEGKWVGKGEIEGWNGNGNRLFLKVN